MKWPFSSPTSPHHPVSGGEWHVFGVFLGVQWVALGVGAGGLALSDQFPHPAERLALAELLVAQVLAASLLFPWLLRNLNTTLILIASTAPFLQLAGMLSSAPPLRTFLAGLYVALWLLLLFLLRRHFLQTPHYQLLATAVSTAATLAAPLLWYLQAEFVTEQWSIDWPRYALASPLTAVLSLLYQEPLTFHPWLPPAILLPATLFCARLSTHLSTTSPPTFPQSP